MTDERKEKGGYNPAQAVLYEWMAAYEQDFKWMPVKRYFRIDSTGDGFA